MHKNKPCKTVSISSLFLFSAPLFAGVVYSQSTTSDPASVGLGWYSSSEPRPTRNFKHADNFVLTSDSTIDAVRWWGLSEGVSHTDLSNFDTFTIEFWTNRTIPNGNIRPLDLIASTTIAFAQTNATATGRSAPSGAIEYMHEATLGDGVDLIAGETYWISISARSIDPQADVWQWQDSDNFDTLSSSFSYAQNRWVVLEDTDSAFELIAVPSPGTGALLLPGCLLVQRRRRRSR
ncbi:MAG: DUF7901 domain-containing protein [Phycisphaerales bacterium]